MAYSNIDTEVMRTSAGVFSENAEAFTSESAQIKNTLTAISTALEQVTKDFNTHNENIAAYSLSLSNATSTMESVWESGAATSFQESFDNFNTAMSSLSSSLVEISNSFATIKSDIEAIVNGNILKKTEEYAQSCSIDSENLIRYADAEDENQQRFASAYGG